MGESESLDGPASPLRIDDPASWDLWIEAVGPAAMLVRIETRMSAVLREQMSSEDIWQETLLHAWRDRAHLEWRGLAEFRRWLLGIAINRIRDAADRIGATKRGTAIADVRVDADFGDARASRSLAAPALFASTTPSRIALHKERAEAMRSALASLPDLVRDVVRLRLFEERSPDDIAADLGISRAAVKHRLRQGSALYRERLSTKLSLRASSFQDKR